MSCSEPSSQLTVPAHGGSRCETHVSETHEREQAVVQACRERRRERRRQAGRRAPAASWMAAPASCRPSTAPNLPPTHLAAACLPSSAPPLPAELLHVNLHAALPPCWPSGPPSRTSPISMSEPCSTTQRVGWLEGVENGGRKGIEAGLRGHRTSAGSRRRGTLQPCRAAQPRSTPRPHPSASPWWPSLRLPRAR